MWLRKNSDSSLSRRRRVILWRFPLERFTPARDLLSANMERVTHRWLHLMGPPGWSGEGGEGGKSCFKGPNKLSNDLYTLQLLLKANITG